MSSERTLRLVNGRLVRSSLFGFWQIGNDPPIPNLPLETASSGGITGALSLSDSADTLAGAGVVAVAGSATVSDTSDSLSATGAAAISALASLSDGADTIAATGAVLVAGSASISDGADSAQATGVAIVAGSLALSDDLDSISAAGSGSLAEIVGAAVLQDGDDTIVAAGVVEPMAPVNGPTGGPTWLVGMRPKHLPSLAVIAKARRRREEVLLMH